MIPTPAKPWPLRTPLIIGAVALSLSYPSYAATQEELAAKLEALAAQVTQLQVELAELKTQTTTAAASTSAPVTAAAVAAANDSASKVDWFGYGELNYSRPRDGAANAVADLGRFVLGASYRFDDRTRFVSELELEHAVASATDPGEVEIEQSYIERRINAAIFAKIGLFLVPVGLLNENHEPTRYYGVFRNFVETAIIPTTWREGGFALEANTENGLRWNVGISTGFNLSKWDATSGDGLESPLGAIHQELALAHAGDLAGFAALNYTGTPGLRFGASIFSGDASQAQPGFDNNRVTLWEAHARWNPGNWDFAGLYARGAISNTAAVNLTLVGNPTLIPESFFGWYLQAAYRAALPNAWTLTPFARYERFNTASSYASLGPGLTPEAPDDEQVFTAGFNVDIAAGVVVKLDYQGFQRDNGNDRFSLGVGYEF